MILNGIATLAYFVGLVNLMVWETRNGSLNILDHKIVVLVATVGQFFFLFYIFSLYLIYLIFSVFYLFLECGSIL